MTTLQERFKEFAPMFASKPGPVYVGKERVETIYQMQLREILSPFVEDRAFMICGPPGTGKTMIATNLIAKVIEELPRIPLTNSINVLVLTFNPDTFYNEFKHYKNINTFGYVAKHHINNNVFTKQTLIMGYKSLENTIFKGGSIAKKNAFNNRYSSFNDELAEFVKNGQLEIRDPTFLERIEGALIIADEAQVMYANGYMNMRGCALDYIMKYTRHTKLCLITATPVANSALEIVPVLNLLLQKDYTIDDFFDISSNTITIQPQLNALLDRMGARISMIDAPNTYLYPNYIIEGNRLDEDTLAPINFIECLPTANQLECIKSSAHTITALFLLEYSALKTYLTSPPVLLGVGIPNQQITLDYLHQAVPSLKTVIEGSAKLQWIYKFLSPDFNNALSVPGNILIFTHMIMYPGAILLEHLLQLMGLVSFLNAQGPLPNHAICLECGVSLMKHPNSPHGKKAAPLNKFKPTYYAYLNRKGLTKNEWDLIFQAIQNPANVDGQLIKVCIGSKAVNVGIGFPHFNKLIVYSMPPSIAMYIQLIGRLVRPGIVNNLPANHQIVHIYNLITIIKHNDLRSSELELNRNRHEQWLIITQILRYLMSVSYLRQLLDRVKNKNDDRILLLDSPITDSSKPDPHTAIAMHNYLYPKLKLLKPGHKFQIISPHQNKRTPPTSIVTLSSRIIILMRAIRHILFLYNTISINDLYKFMKKTTYYHGYDLSVMTEEEIECAVLQLVHLSSIIHVPVLSQQIADIMAHDIEQSYESFIKESILPYLFGTPTRLKRIVLLASGKLKLVYDDLDDAFAINELVTSLSPHVRFDLTSIPLEPSRCTSDLTYASIIQQASRFISSAHWTYSVIDNKASTYLFWAIAQAMIHKPKYIREKKAHLWKIFADLGWLWDSKDFKRYEIDENVWGFHDTEYALDKNIKGNDSQTYYPMGIATESHLYVFQKCGLEPIKWPFSKIPSLSKLNISPLYCLVQHYKTNLIIFISSNISERERDYNSDRRKFRRMIAVQHLTDKSLHERLHNLNAHDRQYIQKAIQNKRTQNEIVNTIKHVFVDLQIKAHKNLTLTRYFILADNITQRI